MQGWRLKNCYEKVQEIIPEHLLIEIKAGEENKTLEFYTELAVVLREQIGLKLDIPAEGITGDSINESIAKNNIKPKVLDKLYMLFNNCDAASYAASHSTADLRKCLIDLKEVIDELKWIYS